MYGSILVPDCLTLARCSLESESGKSQVQVESAVLPDQSLTVIMSNYCLYACTIVTSYQVPRQFKACLNPSHKLIDDPSIQKPTRPSTPFFIQHVSLNSFASIISSPPPPSKSGECEPSNPPKSSCKIAQESIAPIIVSDISRYPPKARLTFFFLFHF